jgi:hypothetical protein
LHKAIGRYYKELQDYESKGATELNLRPAFQHLLAREVVVEDWLE